MLSELTNEGWIFVEPPEREDPPSSVARYKGEPIKAGVRTETIKDTENVMHYKYRTGQYDLEVKIDFDIGRGQVKVEKAEGYGNES